MRVNILNVPIILAICLVLVILAFELGRSIGINQKRPARPVGQVTTKNKSKSNGRAINSKSP